MKHLITIILLTCLTFKAYSQTEYKKHLHKVLSISSTDSTFIFNTSRDSTKTVTSHLTYLGRTKSGCQVLYIKESYPAAFVRHGFKMLYIISSQGKKYFYRDIDKPEKMVKGVLLFRTIDKKGGKLFYKSDINKEIPKFICVEKEDCYDYQID